VSVGYLLLGLLAGLVAAGMGVAATDLSTPGVIALFLLFGNLGAVLGATWGACGTGVPCRGRR